LVRTGEPLHRYVEGTLPPGPVGESFPPVNRFRKLGILVDKDILINYQFIIRYPYQLSTHNQISIVGKNSDQSTNCSTVDVNLEDHRVQVVSTNCG
jgi:hypothetical protein